MISNNEINMENIKETSLLPTNDIIFHCLFGSIGNEKFTKDFIEKILNKNIEEIDLDLNVNLIREHYDDKLGILDVRAKDENGVNYNIEMQNTSSNTLPERILSYWSRLYTGDLKKGTDYDVLSKTIAILIVNDSIDKFNIIEKYHTKWNIREEDYKDIILTDHFEIRIIELPKYIEYKKVNIKNSNPWLDFLLNPKERGNLKKMEDKSIIDEAREKWKEIISDEQIRDRALRLEIARLDYNTGLKHAKEEGVKLGIEQGIEQGIELGEKSEKLKIAKNMLDKGLEVELIIELTGLTKKEIEELK